MHNQSLAQLVVLLVNSDDLNITIDGSAGDFSLLREQPVTSLESGREFYNQPECFGS